MVSVHIDLKVTDASGATGNLSTDVLLTGGGTPPPPPPPPSGQLVITPNIAGVNGVTGPNAIFFVADAAGNTLTDSFFPEYIKATKDGVDQGDGLVPQSVRPLNSGAYQQQPSTWTDLGNGAKKFAQNYPGYLNFEVQLTPVADAVYCAMRVFNDSNSTYTNLSTDCDITCAYLIPDWASRPDWATILVFQQCSVWSQSGGWVPYVQYGGVDKTIIACKSIDGSKLLAFAGEQFSVANNASAHKCVHMLGQFAPGVSIPSKTWSPWQHRAIYTMSSGDLNTLSARYQQDFATGGVALRP